MQTFNPVYVEKPLKNSNYIEVTSMIRAAAKKLLWQGQGVTHLEDSAFQPYQKYSRLLCSWLNYFTLIDCYEAMFEADDIKVIHDLEELISEYEDENSKSI